MFYESRTLRRHPQRIKYIMAFNYIIKRGFAVFCASRIARVFYKRGGSAIFFVPRTCLSSFFNLNCTSSAVRKI